jgi:hypothetical protein
MTWDNRPPEPAGHAPTADEIDIVLDEIEGLWATWSPTLTNLTLGNGTVLAKFVQTGSTVHYRFRFTLGTTSAVGTSPQFTLPVAPADYVGPTILGDALLTDTGTTNRRGYAQQNAGSTCDIIAFSTTGTSAGITATSPHTWASTDVIAVVGTYEAA